MKNIVKKSLSGFITLVGGSVLLTAIAVAAEVGTNTKEGIGSYLVDHKGMTLYTFKKDTAGKSACSGPCVDRWPLFLDEGIKVTGNLKAKDFGAITREDGTKQTTYKGLPLYYFFKDTKPGDTNGQGVNNVWYVATP
jgi:predicted lipoprotein with Yx(FWY)xxD motif